MFRRSLHVTARRLDSTKVWADFSKRSASLAIASNSAKKYILEGKADQGPPSIKRRFNREKYNSPELIDEVFKLSYDFLEKRAEDKYKLAEQEQDQQKRFELEVQAELNNPAVQYNFQYHDKLENDSNVIDYNVPVYRHLGLKHWESYGQMLLMQRLETLSVIPDTLATLVPKAEVNIHFPFSTGVKKWIEPGAILSSNVTSMVPAIKVQEYEHGIDFENQKYTVLIVNPDVPDLASDSFKTSLAFGVSNVKIDYNNNLIDPRAYQSDQIIANYLPPVPEKNSGKQRFCVWVFRQEGDFEKIGGVERDGFDIRAFVEENKLTPVGAHIWRSQWDSNVTKVREMYSLPEGRVFHRVRRTEL